jgi:hypothetical protein
MKSSQILDSVSKLFSAAAVLTFPFFPTVHDFKIGQAFVERLFLR